MSTHACLRGSRARPSSIVRHADWTRNEIEGQILSTRPGLEDRLRIFGSRSAPRAGDDSRRSRSRRSRIARRWIIAENVASTVLCGSLLVVSMGRLRDAIVNRKDLILGNASRAPDCNASRAYGRIFLERSVCPIGYDASAPRRPRQEGRWPRLRQSSPDARKDCRRLRTQHFDAGTRDMVADASRAGDRAAASPAWRCCRGGDARSPGSRSTVLRLRPEGNSP